VGDDVEDKHVKGGIKIQAALCPGSTVAVVLVRRKDDPPDASPDATLSSSTAPSYHHLLHLLHIPDPDFPAGNDPSPTILNAESHTLNPKASTLDPRPETLNPRLYTQNPRHNTQDPKP
jgi:hypothetical protein